MREPMPALDGPFRNRDAPEASGQDLQVDAGLGQTELAAR
jgi:hypothetical protein